jgi:hypothetical protein
MAKIKRCQCGQPAEWLEKFCQIHWEEQCSQTWWEMLDSPAGLAAKQATGLSLSEKQKQALEANKC